MYIMYICTFQYDFYFVFIHVSRVNGLNILLMPYFADSNNLTNNSPERKWISPLIWESSFNMIYFNIT